MFRKRLIFVIIILFLLISCKSNTPEPAIEPPNEIVSETPKPPITEEKPINTIDILELTTKAMTDVIDNLNFEVANTYFSENFVEDRVNSQLSLEEFMNFHSQMLSTNTSREIFLSINDEEHVAIYSTVSFNGLTFFNVDIFTVRNNKIIKRINIAEESISVQNIQMRSMNIDTATITNTLTENTSLKEIVSSILTHEKSDLDKAEIEARFSAEFKNHDPSLPNTTKGFVDLITLGLFDFTIKLQISQNNIVFTYVINKAETQKIALIFKFDENNKIRDLWTVRANLL